MNGKLTDMLGRAAAQQRSAAGKSSPGADRIKSGRSKGPGLFERLADLYDRMERAYEESARQAGLSCAGCETNCCTSFFQHHTHVEWAYLWRGLQALPEARRKEFIRRAEAYGEETRAAMAANALPDAMCPLNEDGLCVLYSHRLMICRMHGTRNLLSLPDGQRRLFPGCARFSTLPCGRDEDFPPLDRTPFYQALAALEMEFRQKAGRPLPRVDLTLAEMLILGPPRIR